MKKAKQIVFGLLATLFLFGGVLTTPAWSNEVDIVFNSYIPVEKYTNTRHICVASTILHATPTGGGSMATLSRWELVSIVGGGGPQTGFTQVDARGGSLRGWVNTNHICL